MPTKPPLKAVCSTCGCPLNAYVIGQSLYLGCQNCGGSKDVDCIGLATSSKQLWEKGRASMLEDLHALLGLPDTYAPLHEEPD